MTDKRSPDSCVHHYKAVLAQIREASSQPEGSRDITLIAVSKKQSSQAIRALYLEGHRDFGENYVQELSQKAAELTDCKEIRWHFIGHLQSNKARVLAPLVYSIHSIDSEKLAKEVAKGCRDTKRQTPLPVFIEVNIDEEPSKTGVLPAKLRSLAEVISKIPELALQGLMCIPKSEEDPIPRFKKLRELEKDLRPLSKGFLSMGMSGDFKLAIPEGASHVRVGTSIFGPR